MKITSIFGNNERIPAKYTCVADNISPPLQFLEVPENAKSLVLIMDDPDIPDFVKEKLGIDVFDHWTVFNIPPETKGFEENKSPAGLIGKTSRGEIKYTGPCPPDGEHRYFFKLYALDKMLELEEGATKAEVEQAMQNHIIEKTELVGLFSKDY